MAATEEQPDSACEDARRQVTACKEAAALLNLVNTSGEKPGDILTHADILLRGLEQAPPQADLRAFQRKVEPLEQALLAIDDRLETLAFEAMIDGASAQALIGYARVLASHRLTPGRRADRFEVLARRLLTTQRNDGRMRVRPPDETPEILDALLAGLPGPAKPEDKQAVLAEVTALREKVLQADKVDDLGELYGEVRTGCVKSAAWLVDPDILLLTINLEVQLHNKIEGWITKLEIHKRNRPSFLSGNPREYIDAAIAATERKIAHALRPNPPPPDIARMAREQGAHGGESRAHKRRSKPGSQDQAAPAPKPPAQQGEAPDDRGALRKLFDFTEGLPRNTAIIGMVVINLISIAIVMASLALL